MRHVLMLCAVTIVAGNVACSGGKLASPTDGSTDRHDASGDVAIDARPRDLPPESGDGQDARDGSDAGDAPGDARDGAADLPAADVITGGVDAADGRGDVGDAPVDAVGADRPADAILDAIIDGVDAPDGQGDAGDATDAILDAGIDAIIDGAPSDAPVEVGRPYVERDCSRADNCVCASNESCSFTCPGGDCAVTCAPGSSCTVTCAAPFGCSISCGSDAQCVLACFLGVCAHWFGAASTLVCDSAGTGCI